jgi:hypothetical protein
MRIAEAWTIDQDLLLLTLRSKSGIIGTREVDRASRHDEVSGSCCSRHKNFTLSYIHKSEFTNTSAYYGKL